MSSGPNLRHSASTSNIALEKKNAIAITGATGGIGSRVIRALTALDPSQSIVALARRPNNVLIPEQSNVRTAYADYENVESLTMAFGECSSLVFISSDNDAESMVRHHDHVIEALRNSEIEHVVYTSIIDIDVDSSFYYNPIHRKTEALLEATEIPWCAARTSVFSDFFFSTWLQPALQNTTDHSLELPMKDGAISFATRDDVAAALAAIALHRIAGIVNLTGPEALAIPAIEIASSALGNVSIASVDDQTYRAKRKSEGMDDWLIEAFASMFRSVEEGRFAMVGGDVERLTARPAVSLQSFLQTQ